MWYWLIKIEGFLLIPPVIVYCLLRGIPFSLRCRRCQRWMFDQQYLLERVCESCRREMVSSGAIYYIEESERRRGEEVKMITMPSGTGFDLVYRRVVKRLGCGRVLEVGCAQGNLLSALQSPRLDLYGIDVQERLIKAAKIFVEGAGFSIADARGIPYKSDSFDYLICTEVLEHIEGDDAVKECYRVLKPGGVALITVPNGKGVGGRITPEHVRLFTLKSISNLLEETGFQIISGQKFGLYIPFVSPFMGLLLRVSGRRLPVNSLFDIKVPEFLAANFFIECRKVPK